MDELIFISSSEGGEVFRSGTTHRFGKVFYFSPGDENFPVYVGTDVQRVLANAVEWVRPTIEPGSPPQLKTTEMGWYC